MTAIPLPRQLIPVRLVHLETPDSYLRRLCRANSIDYTWLHSVIRIRRLNSGRDVRDFGAAINELGGPSPDRFEAAHTYASVGHLNLRGPWAKQSAQRIGCLSCTPGESTLTYPHIRFAFCRRHGQWLGNHQRQHILDAELWKAERMLRHLVASGLVDRDLYETAWELTRDNAYFLGEDTWPVRLRDASDQSDFRRGTDDRIALFPCTVRVIRIVTHPAFIQRITTGRRDDSTRRRYLSRAFEWAGPQRWILVEGIDQFINRRWAETGSCPETLIRWQ